ncbi:DUF6339 family protein [Ruegeria arenilitoris]|uniref:DUF6339 family protein n=1 Tax=Ruegeria arenilitoris TaxID=1173585 RepID=UPI00147F0A81|nr:DUF6339 family protein [Ruegeria arenilitoris]
MRDHDSYDASEVVLDFVGSDDDEESFSDLELIDLTEQLLDIRHKYKDKNKKNIGGLIDSEVVQPVHEALSDHATAFQLSQLGFWRWLSNIACNGSLWQFIKWRFDSEQQVNWGITSPGSIIEVYFYRAWLRGHKMHDPASDDPYFYARLGSSDVWRSHILRQDFGRDREFVKAFLDTIYDEAGQVQVGTLELRTKLIPALRAWTSSSTFSHLSYIECKELIGRLREEGI